MDDREKIKRFVSIARESNTITLTTKNSENEIWSTKVYYGEGDGHLYAIVEKEGHTLKNILEHKKIFFVIENGNPIRFIQGEAEVDILGDTENIKERRFITVKNFGIVPFIRNVKTVVIRIKPTRVYISDFSKGWVPRMEINLEDLENQKILSEELKNVPKLRIYIQSIRPWSLPATVAAVLLGTLVAPTIDLLKLSLVLVGSALAHLGINAFSDYIDYKKGADKWYTLGSSRVLVDEMLKPKELLLISSILFISATVIGLILWYLTDFSNIILYLICIGAVAGIFYAFVPIGWKYVALGDIAVLVAWTGIAFGSYFVQTLNLNYNIILASLPTSLLIVAILQGNNMRDIQDDRKAGYITLASILGKTGSKIYYSILLVLAYTLLIPLVLMKILPSWVFLAYSSIPSAIKNIRWAFRDNFIQNSMLDLFTAKLLQNFSLLVFIGLVINKMT